MRIGIDLGGTKIEGLALADDGAELARLRVPTPREDYPGTLDTIARLVASLEHRTGEAGTVGVGTPGAIAPGTGLLRNSNSVVLNGKPFESDLARRLGRPVRIANDANCFALSEAVDGAGKGAEVVFGVILGTGVGGGVVVGERVLRGANAIAGEWGHNPLPWPAPGEWPGPPCYCRRSGCIETFLSGPGLARDHREASGEELSAEEIARRAAAGDPAAAASLGRHEERLARALAHVINLLDPDVIVLGGGLSALDHLYPGVRHRWQRWVFADAVRTRLVPPRHGDASGVRGAAWLWPRPGLAPARA